MKQNLGLMGTLVALALSMPVHAQFAKPEDAVKYRKASFTVMAAHFGRLGAMANGRVPYDAKAAAENAEIVARPTCPARKHNTIFAGTLHFECFFNIRRYTCATIE